MPEKVTIEMGEDFLDWFRTTVIANDKSMMLVAWWGWEAHKKKAERLHKEGGDSQ